ncbi:type VII secretion protein EccE [Streptomyces cyaneofuscatus]|uniref:Type VII secretion protein EccE n=1 Tax=Streptomyces cyaneofuscatus TaxID=66883 RepID=A0ABZ1F3I5_9ACTN|nr:type VII secretion protein EccE [Streptomyces cyaneofuscatus]WSB10768.1 type VII secretion protein EccE [Streptomyces cyaneofuscatus]WSD45699.1 type VII secretion protein EccE [Streptomyces cyaneofuscatus]WTA89055.1 type VII secretion protein EccE [Streptomyces cyaneofuscatus]
MGAATRERTGRSGRRTSGPSRRQRSNEPAATTPATTSSAPAATTLHATARTGRVRPLRRQLVIIEAALAVAVVGAALGGAWLVPAGVLVVLLVLLAVVRRRGRALQDWLSSALTLRARRRAASPAADAEPMLAPVAENLPGFGPHIYVDRDHRTVGMLGDGTFLTAAVRVEASGEALRPAFGARSLPLSLLGDALRVDDIVLESAQLVQQVRAAPAPHLPQQSVARLSYAPLQDKTGAPALRMTWVAVKLDPELCREAIAARGGGLEGAQRALVRVADHVASRITGAGFRAVVLDQDELNSAVATSACANPLLSGRAGRPDAAPQRRTMETSRVWRCDDRWHTTYAVDRWPELGRGATPLPQLVALLTSVPAYATTFSLTVRRGARQGETSVSGHVRVTGGSDTELVGVRRTLEQAARHAKVGLARLDREQLPGVLATLPLGGAQ